MPNRSLYQFTVLPFGLLAAFRVFIKCMVVVAAHLQKSAVHLFPYLEDWLIGGQPKAQVLSSVSTVLSTFDALGLLVNWDKSILKPVQRIEFIGMVLNSTKAKTLLPQSRFEALRGLVLRWKTYCLTTACSCLSLLGHMAACTHMVQLTRLHLRELQTWLASVCAPNCHLLDKVV